MDLFYEIPVNAKTIPILFRRQRLFRDEFVVFFFFLKLLLCGKTDFLDLALRPRVENAMNYTCYGLCLAVCWEGGTRNTLNGIYIIDCSMNSIKVVLLARRLFSFLLCPMRTRINGPGACRRCGWFRSARNVTFPELHKTTGARVPGTLEFPPQDRWLL